MSVLKEDPMLKPLSAIMQKEFNSLTTKEVELAVNYIAKLGKAMVAPKRLAIEKIKKLKGQTKTENWLQYERAYYADPVVFRGVNVIAHMVVSYGFFFGYLFKNKKLSKKQKTRLEMMSDWASYVNLHDVFIAAVIDMLIFGNAFIEKIYDEGGFDDDRWGIKELKIVHPATMYIERDESGDVLAYWQRLTTMGSTYGTTLETMAFKPQENDIKIYPEHMIHLDWNNFTNHTYGTSSLMPLIDTINIKLGMKEDMAYLIQRWAEPFIAWLVGNENYQSISPNHINLVKQILETQAADKNVALPWYVEPHPIVVGNETMDMSKYLEFANSELLKGLGIPELILGSSSGGREAGAEARMESFVRLLKTFQSSLSNVFRKECLADLIYYPNPDRESADKAGRYRSKLNLYIPPSRWENVPTTKWRLIESISDLRLRLEALVNAGILAVKEGRVELGYAELLNPEELNPANLDKLASADERKANSERVKEETKNPKKFQSAPASPFGAKPAAKGGAKPSTSSPTKKSPKPSSVKK